MKFNGLTKNLSVLSLSALCAGAIFLSCSKSSDGGGGEGGDGGGDGGSNGGGGGSSAGQGGSSTGGSGGNGSGGTASGGGGAAAGGTAGAPAGGTGGTPGTGGTVVSAGAPKFCTDPKWYIGSGDGTHTKAEIDMSTGPAPASGPQGEIKPAGANYDSLWVPLQYKDAKDGEVGLVVLLGLYPTASVGGQAKNLIAAGEIPPVLIAHGSFDPRSSAKAKDLVAEIKAAYPKLSTKTEYITIAGQSTTGAQAFDIAWAEPGTFGNILTGSGSFVCFQTNAPYDALIGGTAKKNLRVSMAVGNCDIFGTLDQRLAAGCDNDSVGGVDQSTCQATWLDANKSTMAALTAKGYNAQLLILGSAQSPATHSIGTWTGRIIDQLRFLYRPIICK